MKAITLNLIMQIQLFILAMQEWSERRWKEITSPNISQLFAQAKRDMEEGKPLPELPPELPESANKNNVVKWLDYRMYGMYFALLCLLVFGISNIIGSNPSVGWIWMAMLGAFYTLYVEHPEAVKEAIKVFLFVFGVGGGVAWGLSQILLYFLK